MAVNVTQMLADTDGEPSGEQDAVLAHWTPERQIAQMLDLCEAQMESALSESDIAIETLIKAFSGFAEAARAMSAATEKMPAHNEAAAALNAQMASVAQQMASAVVAFQFYDKLTQRLGHVRYSLSTLALFVCDRKQAGKRDQWQRLFTTLKRLYRTEEERQIFTMMVEGASAEDAREHIHQSTLTLDIERPGDIELF